ncbi:MAG: DNA repair protein RadA [Thermodesulfobacteriota bacterium]
MKAETVFVCTQCGRTLVKWMGRCPGCGEWNTVVERDMPPVRSKAALSLAQAEPQGILPITEIHGMSDARLKTGMEELDRVLGGGIVARSLILLGGDPGIGKSTLLMQGLGALARGNERVLYISGEESPEQLKLRADRLGILTDNFLVLAENRFETILSHIDESQCSVVVVDSVQSIFSPSLDSTAGSVSQIRHVAAGILDVVKRGAGACFLVGHVTKDGVLAGPKVLEHMVDTVLSFEGERSHPYRILRASKNRFGSSSEIGVFEMGERGLQEVANPSELFLSERPEGVSGSAVTALVEGTRPILAEIQALVTGPVPGQGRRTCLGVDSQRLALMIAVLEKKLGLALADQDIFLNAVGGIRASEPAADLAVAGALLSSFMDRVAANRTVLFGEVGLAGEVRRVSNAEGRIAEAARLGFARIIAPLANVEAAASGQGLELVAITHIKELASLLFQEER